MADADKLPAITLTDPNNQDRAPSPLVSPVRDNAPTEASLPARGRPETPTSKPQPKRPESAGWTSPGKLIRTRSNNANPPNQKDGNGAQEQEQALPATIDPLSQHILTRTNTPYNPPLARPTTADSAPNREDRASVDQTSAPAVQSPNRRTDSFDAQKELRKGVKGVSFISKLMGGKKKNDEDAPGDAESVSFEGRPEGNDAQVFAEPVDNVGFNPQQIQAPGYIKMRSKYKKERDFDRVFLAQELDCRKRDKTGKPSSVNKLRRKSSTPADGNTVWAMKFSMDGKYLAAAGVDGIVRVWAVISSSEDRQKHEKQESSDNEASGGNPHAAHCSAPVFVSRPIREYEGHTQTVLELSWSKNGFLLSSSMDKTIRLWHVSRKECLCAFRHNDFVPSIAFHPKDDRFFLAGSLDSKLRLWSIPDKRVEYTAQLPDMITAVAFTPDGKFAMAGCLSGLCMFYDTDGLKYQSQIHVRSTRGQNAKGSKITGIRAFNDSRGDVKLLITSNDSRTRLYNFRDKNLEIKFRGNENNSSQIRANVSEDGKYVICGSEDRKAYIWSTGPAVGEKRDKRPVEMFEPHDTATTVACFAPAQTRLTLGKSEDPIYDLCNPPPVTLISRAERAESQTSSSRPGTENGSVQATPADKEGKFERPKESASYLARASHKAGNIIVTADFTGSIKVFRQDCAWSKRRLDDWDRSSLFSKRNGRLSRNGSVMTRGSQPSLREGRTSLSLSGPSDRIMSWRQGIVSTPSIENQRRHSSKTGSRDISPSNKSLDQRPGDSKLIQQQTPRSTPPTSTPPKFGEWGSSNPSRLSNAEIMVNTKQARASADESHAPDSPKSGKEDNNPLMLQGGRSNLFWNTEEWKDRAERMHKMHEASLAGIAPEEGAVGGDSNHLAVRPQMARGETEISRLSDEERSLNSEYSDAHEGEMTCRHCGGLSFSARNTKTGTSLVCSKCGQSP